MILPGVLAALVAPAQPIQVPDAPVAAAAPFTLAWQAPDACPDAAAVTAMTTDLLRQRPADAEPPRLHAQARVTRGDDRWHVRLELRSQAGDVHRTLAARDCPLLARAVALLVAVHLDPLAVSRRLEPPRSQPPPAPLAADPLDDLSRETAAPGPAVPSDLPQETATPRPSPPPDLPRETATPVPKFAGHLRLEGGLDAGVLPGLGGDLSVVGGIGAARWRVDAGLLGVPARSLGQPATARFNRLGAVVRGCAVWRVPPRRDALALLGCLGAELGGLHATALAVTAPNPRWTPWAGALVGGAARITVVGPLGLWFGVEAVIALVRPSYTVGTATDPLYTAGSAGVRANFGVDLQFVARNRRPRSTH